jgi:hypothetical protein
LDERALLVEIAAELRRERVRVALGEAWDR